MNFIKKHKSIILSLLVLALFVSIGESVIASRPKTMELVVDAETQSVETTTRTVREALEEQGFDLNNIKVNEDDLDLRVRDNLQIVLDTKKEVTFNNQGTSVNVSTFTNTVEDFLNENGIYADEDDNVSPALDTKITNRSEVTYDNVVIENYTKDEVIEFEKKTENTFDLAYGETKVKVEGVEGQKKLDYTKVTKNEKVVSDELVKETVVKKAVDEVTLVGTKEVVEETISKKVVENSNSSMYKGQTKVIQEGSDGLAKVTYKNDGENREEVEREVVRKAQDRIVEYGTKEKVAQQSSSAVYSLRDLQFHGVINWGGKKFTYYSQSVLPGGGLRIPGRHVNAGGFVADGDGYIVLANDDPKGTVVSTPFGMGKVYDRGTYGNHYDVYTR